MNLKFTRWLGTFLLGLAVGAAIVLGISRLTADQAQAWEEWTLPARFEGEGALTVGCAFWDVPSVTEYGVNNPRLDSVVVGVSGDRGDVEALASIDGPKGTAFVSGQKCAVSVDWSVFPTRARPAD
jgi:hypothetical protein